MEIPHGEMSVFPVAPVPLRRRDSRCKEFTLVEGRRRRGGGEAHTRLVVQRGGVANSAKVRDIPPAVMLKSSVEGKSYAQVLRKAREKVSLRDLGVDKVKVRKLRGEYWWALTARSRRIDLPGD